MKQRCTSWIVALLFAALPGAAIAQQAQRGVISGRVTNSSTNEPLTGAYVVITSPQSSPAQLSRLPSAS